MPRYMAASEAWDSTLPVLEHAREDAAQARNGLFDQYVPVLPVNLWPAPRGWARNLADTPALVQRTLLQTLGQ